MPSMKEKTNKKTHRGLIQTMYFLSLQLTTVCIFPFAVVVKRGLFLVLKMFQVPLLSIKSPIFRLSYHYSVTEEQAAQEKQVGGEGFPVAWVWNDGVFSHSEALIWSLEARGPQRWQLRGSHSYIGFPGLQYPQVSTNSSPSVLLPASDLLYDSLISLNSLQSPLQVSNPITFLCHKNPRARLPKQEE